MLILLLKKENEEEKKELITIMFDKIATLPKNLKEPISSRYFDDLSYAEISEKYNINLQTVKK